MSETINQEQSHRIGQMTKIEGEVGLVDACCEKHGNYQAKTTTVLGRVIVSKCEKCIAEQREKEVESKKDYELSEKRIKVSTLFANAAIPLRFKNKDFEKYTADNKSAKLALTICKKYADDFNGRYKAGGGLVMCGKPGTGKTHLAAAITNIVISKCEKSVLFVSVMQAIRRVKDTYRRDSEKTESEAIAAFNLPDLLIIDEVGVQFGSDTEKMILFEIINNRYQDMLPTILISNLSLEELNDYVGARVVDRMREGGGAIISFDWDSYRGNRS